jgi:hypothetical protein
MAGPQYRRSGTIRLRASDGGFATTQEPDVAVRGDALVVDGKPVATLPGATYAQLAAACGIEAGAPQGLYSDTSGAALEDRVHFDADAASVIALAFADGTSALLRLAPDEVPVLWPEHFDLGIGVDEVNYGVSPGDAHIAEPYAYVGPWTPREGPFWNEAFGAARPLAELAGVDAILAFFQEGMHLAK